ncbi:MAG: C39 family peptidase [Candidatus Sericytochromatia bacterium]
MPQVDRSVRGLNAEVWGAVSRIQNPQQISTAEAQALRSAILKDGKFDTAERDLVAELTQDNSAEVRVESTQSADFPANSLTLGPLASDAKEALAISQMDVYKAKFNVLKDKAATELGTAYERVSEQVSAATDQVVDYVQARVDDVQNFTYQSSEGTRRERQANCGPASAAMVLKRLGLEAPEMSELRASVGAPRGNGSGAFALTPEQVANAVVQSAAAQGQTVTADVSVLPDDASAAEVTQNIRDRLAAGEQVILLTSNIAVQSGSDGPGHYVVVERVNPDGSLVVDDPQSLLRGNNREHSAAEFANSLDRRVNRFGRDNVIIGIKPASPAQQ